VFIKNCKEIPVFRLHRNRVFGCTDPVIVSTDAVVAYTAFSRFSQQTVIKQHPVISGNIGSRAGVQPCIGIAPSDSLCRCRFQFNEIPEILRFGIRGIRPFGQRPFRFTEKIPAADGRRIAGDLRRGILHLLQKLCGKRSFPVEILRQQCVFPVHSRHQIPFHIFHDNDITLPFFIFGSVGEPADRAFHTVAPCEFRQFPVVVRKSGAGAVTEFTVTLQNITVNLHREKRIDISIDKKIPVLVGIVQKTHNAEPLDLIALFPADPVIRFNDEDSARQTVKRQIDPRFSGGVGFKGIAVPEFLRIKEIADFHRNGSPRSRFCHNIEVCIDRFAEFDKIIRSGSAKRSLRKRRFIRSCTRPFLQLKTINITGCGHIGRSGENNRKCRRTFPVVRQHVPLPLPRQRNPDGRPFCTIPDESGIHHLNGQSLPAGSIGFRIKTHGITSRFRQNRMRTDRLMEKFVRSRKNREAV